MTLEMTPVWLNRRYSISEHASMHFWCRENCRGTYVGGSTSVGDVAGGLTERLWMAESPWKFEDEQDATLFILRWS